MKIGESLAAATARATVESAEVERLTTLLYLSRQAYRLDSPVSDRIVDLLSRNPGLEVSPSEMTEVVHASFPAVRKALTRLVASGGIERVARGLYRIPEGEPGAAR